jgi:hypothetical protein
MKSLASVVSESDPTTLPLSLQNQGAVLQTTYLSMWSSSLLAATSIPQHAARSTIFMDKIHMSFLLASIFI